MNNTDIPTQCPCCWIRVLNAFDLCNWAGILEPAGWERVGTDPPLQAEVWRSPVHVNGVCELRCQATTSIVWNSTRMSDLGERWGKFRTWAELAHGGDLDHALRVTLAELALFEAGHIA